MKIPGLSGASLGKAIVDAAKAFLQHDMATLASALAYQALFSIFPFFIFLSALVAYFPVSGLIMWLRQQAQLVFPEQAMKQINIVLDQLQIPQGGLLSGGVILALWTASSGVRAAMHALNITYGVQESRPAWKLYALSLLYTIGIGALLLVSSTLLLIGPEVMHWLARQIGFEQFFVLLWTWIRLPLAITLLALSVAMVYYFAPNVHQRFRLISPGALITVAVWAAMSLLFNYYLQHFANYNAMYGSIGAIIVLLLYFYISAAIMLFGAEINACIEQTTAAEK